MGLRSSRSLTKEYFYNSYAASNLAENGSLALFTNTHCKALSPLSAALQYSRTTLEPHFYTLAIVELPSGTGALVSTRVPHSKLLLLALR